MKQKGKRTLTPKLRFPEFRDKGEWENKPLGQLVIFASGGTPSKTDPKFWDGDIPWISASAMHDTAVYDSELRVTQEAIGNGTRLAEKGSILILVRGSMLFKRVPICIAERDVAFNQDVKSIRPKRGIVTRYLLNHLIASEFRIAINSTGIGAGKIDTEHLKSLIIGIPSSAEQQKIAKCLGSLDGLIAAEGRMLEALKAHKKGLMQQLFPQPGQTQPRLRFPEFQKEREWGEKKLSEITSAIFDGTHQTPTYTEAGIPFYSVENLISGNANKFISKEDYDLATRKNKPEKGDILLTRIGKIGFSQVVTWGHEFSVYVTLAVIKRSSQFNSHYLHCLMQSDFYQSELRSKSLSNAVPPKINMDSLRETKVLIPIHAEQHRIADCLTSLDTRIAAQAAKIDALKQHKRGLMQQLFPAPEEVNA